MFLFVSVASFLVFCANGKTCCISAPDSNSCTSMTGTGTPCKWLDPNVNPNDANLLAENGGVNCVSQDWASCKEINPANSCINTANPPPGLDPSSTPDDCGTAAPTSPPTFEPCTNNDVEYNVQFIIDESGSVTWHDALGYDRTIDFVKDLVTNDVNSVSNISALAFSFNTDFLYSFADEQNDQRLRVLTVLEEEKQNYAKSTTDTYNALKDGLADFVSSPGVTPQDQNLLFLITDGQPYCANGQDPNCKENVCDQTDLINGFANYNVRIILIGITSGFRLDTLDCFVDPQDVYEIENFTPEKFKEIETQVRDLLCPATTPNHRMFVWHGNSNSNSNSNSKNSLIASTMDTSPLSMNVLLAVMLFMFICACCLHRYRLANSDGFKPISGGNAWEDITGYQTFDGSSNTV